jgi:phospholipid/cholesterol/gamma-HCH transport system permease protein
MISSKIGYFRLVAQLLESTVGTLVRPSAVTFDNMIVQIRSIGVGAIPAASLIALTAGFVLALVLELQLSQIGKVEIVPSLLWIILTEQVVPVGVALIFAGRSVSAVTAELGSMQVSEEIKALYTMGIDVVPYLLVPRFLGFQIMLPIVTSSDNLHRAEFRRHRRNASPGKDQRDTYGHDLFRDLWAYTPRSSEAGCFAASY